MRKILCIAMLAAVALSVIGCNTTRGAGRDIERAGEKVQDVAK